MHVVSSRAQTLIKAIYGYYSLWVFFFTFNCLMSKVECFLVQLTFLKVVRRLNSPFLSLNFRATDDLPAAAENLSNDR